MSDEKKPAPIIPGVPLTAEQRAAIATENEEASKKANEQAQEQIRRDIERGVTPGAAGALTDVAGMLKKKLENDEFSVVVDDNGRHVPARPHKDEE